MCIAIALESERENSNVTGFETEQRATDLKLKRKKTHIALI